MFDLRIYTFLKLAEVLNYHKTAELLNMTQPAVTQHIKYLEKYYGKKLVSYEKKVLSLTESGKNLKIYLQNMVNQEKNFMNTMTANNKERFVIGATKTIGDYMINEAFLKCLDDPKYDLELVVDNSENLLKKLDNFEIDIVLLEGFFNKSLYDYKPIKNEKIVGICQSNHEFCQKEVKLEEVLKQNIILREKGSGTRSVFEQFLNKKNYTVEAFNKTITISSFKVIEEAVRKGLGISFVYEAISLGLNDIEKFIIKDEVISHELNFVYSKGRRINENIFEMLKIK